MGIRKKLASAFESLFMDEIDELIKTGTDEELEEAYERRRLQWMANGQNGTGRRTDDMIRIDREISRRSAERWQNDPRRSKDPYFRWTDENRWE